MPGTLGSQIKDKLMNYIPDKFEIFNSAFFRVTVASRTWISEVMNGSYTKDDIKLLRER